jgi:hypothetical protein
MITLRRIVIHSTLLIGLAGCVDNVAPKREGVSPRTGPPAAKTEMAPEYQEMASFSTSSVPAASIGAHATVPSLDVGQTTGSIKSSAKYVGEQARVELRYGAKSDQGTQVIPDQMVVGTHGSAEQAANCAASFGELNLQKFKAACFSYGGEVKTEVAVDVKVGCGVHLYGAGTFTASYLLPIPTVGNISSDGKPSFGITWKKFGETPTVAEGAVEAYNGKCESGPAGGGWTPEGDPGENCHWYRWYEEYADGSWRWTSLPFTVCDGPVSGFNAVTGTATLAVAAPVVGCAALSSTNTSVAAIGNGSISATGAGRAYVERRCGDIVKASAVNVSHPSVQAPVTPSCCNYLWYHKEASGMWTNQGLKVLAAATSPGASANLVSLDLAKDVLQAVHTVPSSCQTAPNICWLTVSDFDAVDASTGYVNAPNASNAGWVSWYGGACPNGSCPSVYPMHVVWRYNGTVVRDVYTNTTYGDWAPSVRMNADLEPGDRIVVNATVTDARGTTITTSYLLPVEYFPESEAAANSPRNRMPGGTAANAPPRDPKHLGRSKPDLKTLRPSPKEGHPLPTLPPIGKP